MNQKQNEFPISENVNGSLDEYLESLKNEILVCAGIMAKRRGEPENITLLDVSKAIYQKSQVTKKDETVNEKENWISSFFSYVSPLTIISTILAILFGVLGLWGSGALGGVEAGITDKLDGKAFLDIACDL